MAINENSLRFSVDSILPLITSSEWTYKNASVVGETIVINPGGLARCIPTQTIINSVFQYFKVAIDFTSTSITPESNFKNSPYIFIVETYKNENNELYINRSRTLGFNTFNKIDENGRYNDTTIFSSLNKEIGYYSFEIRNNTTNNLIINNIGVYTSIDVSGDQIGNIINAVNAGAQLDHGLIYCTADYQQLLGIGAVLKGTDKEFKFKPLYNQGLLGEIKTNFGVDAPFTYIPHDIDLTT